MQPFCSTFFLQPVRESFGRSSISASLLAALNGKAFAVDPGYAPIPSKLVSKITSGQFVNPANLLTKNLHAQELEPHTFLDGKLLVAPTKKQVIEITDILPWMQTFSIYSWIFCTALPLWWQDFTQYHSLIMQMVRQFPGSVWQNYDTAFRKGAVASGIMDWSKMNLDLYNFHTRIPSAGSQLSSSHSRPTPPGGLPTLLNTAVHGTMTNAAGHLGHADTITFVWVARACIVTISSPLPGAALSATDAGVALSSSASNPVNSVYSGHCNVSFFCMWFRSCVGRCFYSSSCPCFWHCSWRWHCYRYTFRTDKKVSTAPFMAVLHMFRPICGLSFSFTWYRVSALCFPFPRYLPLVKRLICPCIPGSPKLTVTS